MGFLGDKIKCGVISDLGLLFIGFAAPGGKTIGMHT